MEGLSLSPVGLFLAAGLVGKFLMAAPFLASLWCWVLIVEGVISVVRLGRGALALLSRPAEVVRDDGPRRAEAP